MARFEETVNIRQVNTDTGFAQASNSLLNRLNTFGQQATGIARKKAAEKGVEEARQVELRKKDGVTQAPEKREASFGERILSGNITQDAYNKTISTAYLASIGNDVREGVRGIESENPDNIVAFNEQVSGYAKGILGGVDQATRPEVQSFLDGQISNARARVHDKTIKRNKAEAAAETSAAIQSFSNDSATLAREGNQVGAAESIAQAFTLIDGMVDAGNMRADEAAVVKREIERESSEQVSRKNFDDIIANDGPEAAQAELDSIRTKTKKGWTPDEWKTYTNSQQADINRQLSRQSAAKQEVNKEAQIALRQYEASVSLGFEVSNEEKLRVKGLVTGRPEQDKFDRINKTAAFSILPADARARQLNDTETGKLEDVADFSAMLQANNEINKMATKDGYSLGVKQGLINEITFNPSDPLTLSLKADQAETLSGHYGVKVSPLSDGEANALSASITEMTVAEKVQLANTLNQAPAVWSQISPKNQQAFSMAGATGDDVLMATVFNGQELLKEKLVTPAKSSDYLSVSDDFLGDVYGVQDKSAILESAKAHYASTVGNSDVFDSDAWEDSLSAVTGGIGEVNGNKLELPRGVDEDTFEDFIDEFSGAQVEALGGALGFDNNQAANQIQNGKIKSVGANKYIVMTNESQALFKADGTPLIIEYTAEQQAQQEAVKFMKSKTIESSISKLRSF